MTPLATHVSIFLRERLPLERRASERTCDTYALALRLFFEFAAKRLKVKPSALGLEQLDAPLVLDFLSHLEIQRANSPATRNVRLAAIRTFMRFIEYREPSALEQIQRIRAIPMKRTDTRLVDYLARDEMQALLDAPSPNTRDGIRDRAMLYVAYSAGLRVSELVGLRLENLSFNPRLSIHVLGKGRRERALPLWRETATALRERVRGDAAPYEVIMLGKGGEEVHVRVSPRPVFAHDGAFRGVVAVLTDVTEQVRAAAALRASESELRELSARLRYVQEMERKRIAADLHDGLGQSRRSVSTLLSFTPVLRMSIGVRGRICCRVERSRGS